MHQNLSSWLELMNDPTGVIYDFPTIHQYFMVGKMFAICHDWHSVDFVSSSFTIHYELLLIILMSSL